MTNKATELQRALAALVSAVDCYHEHRRAHPDDSRGLGRLGEQIDQASIFFPSHVTSTIMSHLADSSDVFVCSE